jgi:SAM-dependent methyltransferase
MPVMESAAEAADRRLHGSSFGAAAAEYARHRPRYAEAAIRWCLQPARTDRPRVADIGAGTGILTSALHQLGADVVAVEPDPQMLTELRRHVCDVPVVPGTAEAIPLEDGSVDAVLAGQAMHWFEMDRALPEIARVLRPGGILAGLWNIQDDQTAWVAEFARLSEQQGPLTMTRWKAGFPASPHGATLAAGGDLFEPAEEGYFENPRTQTADSLLATLGTHSHLLVMPEPERTAFLDRVSGFLHSNPATSNGEFTLPLITAAVRAIRR